MRASLSRTVSITLTVQVLTRSTWALAKARAFNENEADMKKLIKPAAIALLIFMIAFRPGESANAVKNMVGVLGEAANGAAQFISGVLS